MKSSMPDDPHVGGRLLAAALASAFCVLALAAPGALPPAGARSQTTLNTNAATNTGPSSRRARRGRGAAPNAVKPKPRRSVVRGRVVYADTARPVRRATVRLGRLVEEEAPTTKNSNSNASATAAAAAGEDVDYDNGVPAAAVTNRAGQFRFGDVRAGKYTVTVEAAGILSGDGGLTLGTYGVVRDPHAEAESVIEADGANEVTTEIRVLRGSAISGRVTYGDGEPATNVSIFLFSRRDNLTRRIILESVAADDRGYYRIEGLPPGEYVVGASENNTGYNGSGENPSRAETAALVGAYHPSATSMRTAEPVRVGAGAEVGNVDIRFVDGELRRVSGTVRWRSGGRPVQHALIKLERREEPGLDISWSNVMRGGLTMNVGGAGFMTINALAGSALMRESDEQGQWSFSDVPEGNYVITSHALLRERRQERRAGEDELTDTTAAAASAMPGVVQKRQEITVIGGDVTGLNFLLSEGARVSGTVSVEGGTPLPSQVYVGGQTSGQESLFNFPQPVRRDGTFELEAVAAGEVLLDVIVPADENFYVKSISAPNGADLMRAPLIVGDDTNLGGVRVLLGSDGATLSGRALAAANGRPLPAAMLFLVPAEPGLWGARSARFFATAGLDGSFRLNCAPGSYLLITWRPDEDPGNSVAGIISARGPGAPRITLRPGERKTLDIIVPGK